MRSERLLLASALIDSLGSGLVAPFSLLFGYVVVGLSLPVTGLAAAIASGVAMAAGPIAGSLVDRHGAARVAAAGNVLAAAGGVGLLLSREVIAFTLASLVCAAAQRTFWASFSPLIAETVHAGHRERWFGRIRAARFLGITVGGALAGPALLLGERSGLQLIVAADVATYIVAAILLYATRKAAVRLSTPDERVPQGYRRALSDRANLFLAGLNITCTLMATAPLLAMPVFLLDRGAPLWLPGIVSATIAATLAVALLVIPRWTTGRSRLAVLAIAAATWSAGCLVFTVTAGSAGRVVIVSLLAAALLGAAEAAYTPTADALPLALAPRGLAGRYSAVHQFAWGVSGTVAPLLTAALLTAGPDWVWLVLAGVALAAAGAYAAAWPGVRARAGQVGSVPAPA